MKSLKYLTIASLFAISGCSTTPPLPRDSQSSCMLLTSKAIIDARSAHGFVQGNISKVSQCRVFAESRSQGDRASTSNNALGNIVIQNSINQGVASDNYDKNFKACMADPNTSDRWAPAAHTQFEKILFGISTINTDACPADFRANFEEYKANYTETVRLARELRQFNTANWSSIVKLKIPGNETEKLIIDNDNRLGESFARMRSNITQKTGWCPNPTFTAYYPCK